MNAEKEARMKELEEIILSSEFPIRQKRLLTEYQELYDEKQAEEKAKAMVLSKEMRNRRRRGKYAEKRTAMEVGGVRRGGVGMPDVEMEWCDIEVKERKKHIASVTKDMIQARRLARKGKTPILKWIFRDTKEAFAIWDWKDFEDWHGDK